MTQKSYLVSALTQLSTLQAGQTISVKGTNVTITKHSTWGEMIGYRNDSHRKQALSYIKTTLTAALTLLQTNPSDDLTNSFEPALKGITILKETYKGDFYTIAEIDRIIESTKRELAQILRQLLTKPNSAEVSDEICSEIMVELTNIAKAESDKDPDSEKFRADPNAERRITPKEESILDEMVALSDSTGHPEPIEHEVGGVPLVSRGESGVCRPTNDCICVDAKSDDIKDLIVAASVETVQIVLAASDEIKQQLDDLSKSQSELSRDLDDKTILDSRAETVVTESRKIIKNSDSTKDTVTHVSRSTSNVIDDHIIIYMGETVLTSVDPDAESSSDCIQTCSCLDFPRRNVTRSNPARANHSNVRCPAFSTQDPSGSETTNGPPALIRLAWAFEQWLETLDND